MAAFYLNALRVPTKASVTLLLYKPEVWPQGSGSGCRCSPLHEDVSCPDFPVFCGPAVPSPFLSEHTSRISREFPVWKRPAWIWALSRTRELAGKPCFETEQPPGRWGAPQAMWVLVLLWVWGAQQVLCLITAEGKHFLTGSHTPAFYSLQAHQCSLSCERRLTCPFPCTVLHECCRVHIRLSGEGRRQSFATFHHFRAVGFQWEIAEL